MNNDIVRDAIHEEEMIISEKAKNERIDKEQKENMKKELDFLHTLISYEIDISSMNWSNLENEDYIAILIESDLNLNKAIVFVTDMLKIRYRLDKRKKVLPRTILMFNDKKEEIRDKLETSYINMISLDPSSHLRFHHDTIFEVVEHREVYRSMVLDLPPVTATSRKELERIKKSASYEAVLIDIDKMRSVLMEEIVGIRTHEVKGEFDEYGNPKVYSEVIDRNIGGIPMYFKLLEELKEKMYSTSNQRASASDYLKSQKALDLRIEKQRTDMIDRAKNLPLDA